MYLNVKLIPRIQIVYKKEYQDKVELLLNSSVRMPDIEKEAPMKASNLDASLACGLSTSVSVSPKVV